MVEILAADQLRHGDLLHLGDLGPVRLLGRGETPGPGGGILDESTGKSLAGAVGVTDGMRNAGIRHLL